MSGIFGSDPAPPPAPTPPARMVDPASPVLREARNREQTDLLRRGGRRSTILTTPATRSNNFDSYDRRPLG